ncbi:MAG: bifunctional phosphopantothenoylcysteine decarboxylase/phosphopantothenate--cysteine ligase CoaBC [Gammaproteobacteria bacterium]|nr:bifunctional phosphopantothenoylcysteine decarboxylase/phosphopantothenate--cysteine ligase CoaBC [Gammaproteobacteria bacterium]
MTILKGKKILLGVSGGIAAYKSALLVRILQKHGAEVRVVMTKSAQEFVRPLTFSTLSGNKVYCDLFDQDITPDIKHISLARWADLILIAPATANIVAKIAHGIADDLLSTVCLSTTSAIVIAPAMNKEMWLNAMTQKNIEKLQDCGITILGPSSGEQACGEVGLGRMIEPDIIVDMLYSVFAPNPLLGLKIMVTAGPTQEHMDAVRFMSNHSSGKMGYAIAKAAANLGASVCLISGPTNQPDIWNISQHIKIISAEEIYQAVMDNIHDDYDIFIGAAAVSDYRFQKISDKKIKKHGGEISLTMAENKDIIKDVASLNLNKLFVVGFAAETDNIVDYAKAKLNNKNLDLIFANRVGENIGFNVDTNELVAITRDGKEIILPLQDKYQLAYKVLNLIVDIRHD